MFWDACERMAAVAPPPPKRYTEDVDRIERPLTEKWGPRMASKVELVAEAIQLALKLDWEMAHREGGDSFVLGVFAGENFGGANFRHPCKSQSSNCLNAHPSVQGHAAFRVLKICKSHCH